MQLLILLVAGWVLAAAFSASRGYAFEGLEVGQEAPNFTMVGSDGKTYKLSDFRGKQAVIVAWYPRAFTGGCTKQCTSFKEQGADLRAFNVAYFTASCDSVEKNKEFAESLKADYPILSDPDGAVATTYGIYNTDRKTAQRNTFIIGVDGKILFIDTKVKTDSHASDMAKKLEELGVAKK